ncbi:hypothetical protein MBANPS3_002001 [Mucor bainieri]
MLPSEELSIAYNLLMDLTVEIAVDILDRIRQDEPTDTTEILHKIDAAHHAGQVLMDQAMDHQDTVEGCLITDSLEVFLLTSSVRIKIVEEMIQTRSSSRQQQQE